MSGVSTSGHAQSHAKAQNHCDVESKKQYYKDFLASSEGSSKNRAFALEAAKKYLACPESNDQPDILARLNLAVGQILNSSNSGIKAVPYLIKAASYNSTVRTSPETYAYLAEAYLLGPYARLSAVYTSRFAGEDETDESLLALEDIYQIVDRIIDAYARAVALEGVQPTTEVPRNHRRIRSSPTGPTDWIEDLTVFYKFRHKGSEGGLEELIANILFHPIPSEPPVIIWLPEEQ